MERGAVTESGLATLIGGRVRSVRTGRGWTLDDLAEHSGVSRRMVVNVEQGVTNASIATLLRLSTALGVSLASLVDLPEPAALTVTRRGDHHVLWEGEHGGQGVLLTSTEAPNVVELWDWVLGPRDSYSSEAHSPGTRELLHVLAGSVTITVTDQSVALGVGDAVWFAGDAPHTYANKGKRTARFALSVYQPGLGA
jgi:transcriptional regulator with XRE-family HTH domain